MLRLGEYLTLPLLAVRSVSGESGAAWAQQDVIEGKPRLQWMGEVGETLSVGLYLHAQFCQPSAMLDALKEIKASGTSFQVWTDGGSYWGNYVIGSIQYRNNWTLADGTVVAMSVDVSLKEPGGEDVELTRPPGVSGYATPELIAPPPEDTSGDPNTVDRATIVRS
jgi:phage protein U